ncbi:hypothetical protein IHQ56_13940 [Methylobacillus flagellatus]|uniref:hypothetical protein n=1 Tax=Methylobacillus flagellatus TaxID=405 RepID=UPI002853A4B0|nr:hypothetical protein [Methylobacillus flagellatus]MDR5172920.1 hypothetical protein [Methylobacillus flagellatus]
MKLNRQDWQRLALPLTALLVALVFAVGIVAYALAYRDEVGQRLQQQQSQLMQARSRLLSSDQERENIIRYLPVYQRLISQGFIGEEHRIEWVDALRNTHQSQRLFGIKYGIGAQAAYQPGFVGNTAPFTLYRSIMKLELPLLHEGDLLVLLDGLKRNQSTPFLVRDCTMERSGVAVTTMLAPVASVACEIDWLTLRESTPGATP